MKRLSRDRLHEIIFEADTRAGKLFDIVLLLAILLSVVVAMLETISSIQEHYGAIFYVLEWIFTLLFLAEYIVRLYVTEKPIKYAVSFFGIVDLLSILPLFLSLFIFGTQSLLMVRALRLLRLFRILKLGHFLGESQVIMSAIIASRNKLFVFLYFILIMVTITGSIMYVVEGGNNEGFSSVPNSIYWAIVTLTTVGYGDISPITDLGRFLSAVVMIMGYAVIAVPTGIVTGELVKKGKSQAPISTQACRYCSREGHEHDAKYCKYCGEALHLHEHADLQ